MGCECQKGEEKISELKSDERDYTKNQDKEEINEYLSKKNNNNGNVNKNYSNSIKNFSNDNKNNNIPLKIHNLNNQIKPIDPKEKPKDDFSRYVFSLINSLRQNPESYIDTFLKAKNNITIDKSGIKIYKSSVKVAINTGEKAFDLAIEVLRHTEPMPKLIYNPNLTIDIPTNENDIKSKAYLPAQIRKKIDSGIEIKSFWKDVVKDADTCFILTIVDDSGSSSGNKRNDILDKNNKYIGISSAKIGKSFACYFVIS